MNNAFRLAKAGTHFVHRAHLTHHAHLVRAAGEAHVVSPIPFAELAAFTSVALILLMVAALIFWGLTTDH